MPPRHKRRRLQESAVYSEAGFGRQPFQHMTTPDLFRLCKPCFSSIKNALDGGMEKKRNSRKDSSKRPRHEKHRNQKPNPARQPKRGVIGGDGRHASEAEYRGLPGGRYWIYGRHAAAATISNDLRRVHRILATPSALKWLQGHTHSVSSAAPFFEISPQEIDALLPQGVVHQGICVETEPLPPTDLTILSTVRPSGPVIVLDQITDPQNIGAIFRSAAAFGAQAVIVQDRRTPPLAGALAKAAAGAIESVPCIEVVNIARTLRELQALGYFCVGLAGGGAESIASARAWR